MLFGQFLLSTSLVLMTVVLGESTACRLASDLRSLIILLVSHVLVQMSHYVRHASLTILRYGRLLVL